MPARVTVVGSINLDLVAAVSALPTSGQTVLGHDLKRFHGGKGANQAVAAARMGASVAMIGRVGMDEAGADLLAGLRAEGIDVASVERVDGPSGTALITVDQRGSNTIVYVPGANIRLTRGDVEAARTTIEASDALLLQLELPLDVVASAARIAHQAGVDVFLNPSPAAPIPDALLRDVTYLVLNETELAVLTSDGGPEGLLQRGVGSVVLTRGERGARLVSADRSRDVAAFRVESVDATAAGDAFLGALAAFARERGLDAALDTAAAAGALATTRWGAQPSLPTLADVVTLLSVARPETGMRP